jgi:AcrR family transcriptional regulator
MDDDGQTVAQPRRPRGRPRRDEELMPRILDAAERLFAEQGPVSVTIRDIAAEADLPHSAIYRYFESKDDVLRQVLLRGRDRQIEHETELRREGLSAAGGLEWLMEHNRAYVLATVRLALQGETTTSLGLDPDRTVARTSLAALQGGVPYEPRTDLDPRMVLAALVAIAFGYAVGEDWIMDTLGMRDCDADEVRAGVDEVMTSMIALAKRPAGTCGEAG